MESKVKSKGHWPIVARADKAYRLPSGSPGSGRAEDALDGGGEVVGCHSALGAACGDAGRAARPGVGRGRRAHSRHGRRAADRAVGQADVGWLAPITLAGVFSEIAAIAKLALTAFDMPTPQAPRPAPRAITTELIRNAPASIPPDVERDAWARLGMAIKSEIPGAASFDLWNDWSARGETYDERNPRDTWRSIKAGGATSMATLFGIAKDHGYRFLLADAVQVSAPDAAAPTWRPAMG